MMLLSRSLTSRWPPRRLILPLALCLGLGGVICREAEAPSTASMALAAPSPVHDPPAVGAVDPVFTVPSVESLAEVVDRPLFSPTRRSTPPPARATSPSPSGLALVGIILSNGAAHALIERGQPARMERIAEGEDVDGWTVESIGLDRVVLRRAGLRADLRMVDAPSSATRKATAWVVQPAGDPAVDHEIAVQAYMDAHGGMLPAEAQ
jgi:hypothetical protein